MLQPSELPSQGIVVSLLKDHIPKVPTVLGCIPRYWNPELKVISHFSWDISNLSDNLALTSLLTKTCCCDWAEFCGFVIPQISEFSSCALKRSSSKNKPPSSPERPITESQDDYQNLLSQTVAQGCLMSLDLQSLWKSPPKIPSKRNTFKSQHPNREFFAYKVPESKCTLDNEIIFPTIPYPKQE